MNRRGFLGTLMILAAGLTDLVVAKSKVPSTSSPVYDLSTVRGLRRYSYRKRYFFDGDGRKVCVHNVDVGFAHGKIHPIPPQPLVDSGFRRVSTKSHVDVYTYSFTQELRDEEVYRVVVE